MAGWPWPLDAVQNWFESFWESISGWIQDAIAAITSFVTEAVSGVSTWISDAVSAISSWVSEAVSVVFTWISEVASWVNNAAVAVARHVTDSVSVVFDWIGEGVGWLWDQAEGILTDIWTAVKDFGEWLAEQIGEVGGWLSGVIWGWVEGALNWASDTFLWLRDEITTAASWTADQVGVMFDGAVGVIGGALEAIFRAPLEAVSDGLSWFSGAFGFLDLLDVGTRTTTFLDSLNATFTALLEKASPIPPETAFKMTSDWMWEMRNHWYIMYIMDLIIEGASLGQIETHAQALQRDPQVAASMDLAKRWFAAPYEYGFSVLLEQYWNKEFTPVIPPVVDLIKFVVREVITPERFYELMPYHGFSAAHAKNYWEAHWILPSPGNLYDAFHRKVISAEELNKFIVWHDYSPNPRPGISISDVEIMRGILKRLIPRVDLRYAWEIGRISDEELVERYETLGYEEDSELMAEIQMVRALTEEIGKVRTEWIRDHIDGFITEEICRANLLELGHSELRADYYIAHATLRRERELKKDLLGIYRDKYLKDQIDPPEFEARVHELIVIPEVADLFIEKAYTRKYAKPKPPRETEAEKALKQANKYRVSYARELYRRYAITKEGFIALMEAAEVDPIVARARADYEELKLPRPKPTAEEVARRKEEARVQTLAVRAAVEEFHNFVFDEDELLTRLLAAGLSEVLATAQMQLESIRRPPPPISPEEIARRRVEAEVKRLTGLALAALYRRYAVEKEELIAGLIAAGFDPAEAAARADYEEARRPVPKPSAEELEARREARRIQKLAESEALTLFRAAAITGDELRERLRILEYSEDLIEAIVRFEEIKLALKAGE